MDMNVTEKKGGKEQYRIKKNWRNRKLVESDVTKRREKELKMEKEKKQENREALMENKKKDIGGQKDEL